MNRTVSSITARLSLRSPQEESLEILANILESIELSKAPDLMQTLKTIEGMYPSVKDFEREFPSLCFAIATGVGNPYWIILSGSEACVRLHHLCVLPY